MSITSDVAVAIRNDVLESLSETSLNFLNQSDERHFSPDGTLFVFKDTKWYVYENTAINDLVTELKSKDTLGILVREACFDYPDSDENDFGDWLSNPWNLNKQVSVQLYWE